MKLKAEQIKSVINNLSRYIEKECSLAERIGYNTSELASFVASEVVKDIKSGSFFKEESPLLQYIPKIEATESKEKDVLPENAELSLVKLSIDEAIAFADFCKKLTYTLKGSLKLKLSPKLFARGEDDAPSTDSVAFSESPLLSLAFSEFKKSNLSLSPSYARSFTDACEDVYSGNCKWCILPIENSRDGALLTVFNLIERYELCISRVCVIKTDETTTKFALLCSGTHGIIDMHGRQSIVLRLPVRDCLCYSRIYAAAALLGVDFVNTVALPLVYTDGYAHISTFSSDGDKLFSLLLFLSTLHIDFTLIGAYE